MAQCSGTVMVVFLLLFATPSWCFPNWTPSTCTFPGCTQRPTTGYYNLSENVTNGPICNSHDPEKLFWQDIGSFRNQTAVKVPFYNAHSRNQYVYQEIVSRNSTNFQIRLVIPKFNGQRNFYLCGQSGTYDDEFGIQLAKPVTLIDITARVNNMQVAGMNRLPQNKTFNEGETIPPFVCSPNDGEPRKHTATLTIRYEGGLIESSARKNYILHRIPSIRVSSGQYECRLANLANTHPLTLTVNIAIYFGPDFSKTPQRIVVYQGEKLSIPCLVGSRPELISLTISTPSGTKLSLTTDYLAAPVNPAPWERTLDISVTDSANSSYAGTYTLEGISDRTGRNITTTFKISVIILTAGKKDSCLIRRMLKAGIDQYTAIGYEERFLHVPMSEQTVGTIQPVVLQFIMKGPKEDVKAIQDCIAQTSTECKTYSPCKNGGHCGLSLAKTAYVCECDEHHTGDYCKQPLRASGQALEQLENRMAELEEKTKDLTEGCNRRTLGYKYQSKHNAYDDRDEGQIASISFHKKHTNTVLKLSYSSNIRTYTRHGNARWYFKIDHKECVRPTKIDIIMFQSSADNTHIPAVLTGICESTSGESASTIAAGDHTITVHVGWPSFNYPADANSGWQSTSILEVQEMCPQF